MNKKGTEAKLGLAVLLASVLLLSLVGCTTTPSQTDQRPQPQPSQAPQSQPKVTTATYNGEPAIIFRLDDVAKGRNEEAVENIVRLFGKNNMPLSIGIIPHADGQNSYELPFLKQYLDAGIIDLSIHGNQRSVNEFDTLKSGMNYQKLRSDLVTARSQLQQYYGVTPVAFTVPDDYFSQDGYRAVQDAGFKVFSTQKAVEPYPSVQFVDYAGNWNESGMSRLCAVSSVANWDVVKQKWGDMFSADLKNELFYSIDWGIGTLGVAVVRVYPQAFLDSSNKLDVEKLNKLDAILKLSRQRAVITTFGSWHKYVSAAMMVRPFERKKKTPAYNGGRAIIFRMDDAEKGVNEKTVEEIIKLFERNGVPLDVGVMPFAGGQKSHEMPFLLKYLDAGVIDVSVHGYKNTFLEFHTIMSGATYKELDQSLRKCFEDAYGKVTYNPTKTNYEELKSGLAKSRENFRRYFGIAPAAFTVPYYTFDEAGYKAAQDAGFKVFSSGMWEDPSPSGIELVDYFGRRDPNGMYRLPAIGDVAEWSYDECRFVEIQLLDSPADDLHGSIMSGLTSNLGIAVLVLHPQAFVDANNKPDPAKLSKLDSTIRYIINHRDQYGVIITFQSWYDYTSQQKPRPSSQ